MVPPNVLRCPARPAAINGLLPADLEALVPDLAPGEARRLVSLVHRRGALPATTPAGIRRRTFEAVRERTVLPALEVVEAVASAVDPFVKYAFRAPDGSLVEAVRIPLEHPRRFSVCVSSQVGCAMGCTFCGTARLGLRRSLQAWEIVEQVRAVRDRLPAGTRVHGIVFQGMGEPLANLEQVLQSIRVFWNPSAMAIDATNITVCTSGLAKPLAELVHAEPRVRIALSIGSARPAIRERLIPPERTQPLQRSLAVLAEHVSATRNAPVFALTLLAGVNDTDEDVDALIELVARFVATSGVKPRVSLIRYSPRGGDDPYQASPEERVNAFRERIGSRGFPVLRRYSGGADVGAACGQLGLKWAERRAP